MLRDRPAGDRRRPDPGHLRAGRRQRLAGRRRSRWTGPRHPGRPRPSATPSCSNQPGTPRPPRTTRSTGSPGTRFPLDVEGQRRELRPAYNRAGALEQVRLDDTVYVQRIAYDAKGQRALIAYGNGVMTRYAYDPHTFRLDPAAQRALHARRRRRHLPPDRRRCCRTTATTTTSPATSSPSATARPAAASPTTPTPSPPPTRPSAQLLGQRRRAGPALHLRPDLPAAHRDRPRIPGPARRGPVDRPAARHRYHPGPARTPRALPLRRGRQHAAARATPAPAASPATSPSRRAATGCSG